MESKQFTAEQERKPNRCHHPKRANPPSIRLLPALSSRIWSKPWGLKEFFIRDPFRNLILFAERISEEEASSVQEG